VEFDPFLLSRIQFAANISFHILFPTITIGLCWALLFFRLMYTFTQKESWEHAYYFWVKIFALTFALGVVSGITMSFQFGTNWPGFMERVGNIAGPLLGYEVLTAFFLEASFLGIMLFGKNKVSNRTHLLATSVVAIGTSFSAFWILSLNSWMHTPQGFEIREGIAYATSWLDIIFNPSFPYRLAHMVTASLLTCAFFVAGISAWRIRKGVAGEETWKALKAGVFMAAVLAPTQAFIGDLHGLNTLQYQPAKIAAMEGIWETEKGAPLTLFGIPDEENQTTHFAIKIPKLASLILTHDWDGEIKGINDFEHHPPVAPVFYGFRIMVGMGVLMILVAWWCSFGLIKNKTLNRWQINTLTLMTFSGWVAVLAGWYVTEIGRQPWMVQGVLKTSEVVADHGSPMLLTTLIAYLTVYLFLLGAYISTLRYMSSKPARSLVSLQKMHHMTGAD
jgi:cytochrome d ubiquinol oxidase subunit I